MASVATGVLRGDNLVGLQPDDRTPSDWLRMVARVFAAYRLTPLEQSIVAYIDGFHLTLENEAFPEAIIGITDGQAFVDDQFIGFNNTSDIQPESKVVVDISRMLYDEIYSVVLCYTWVNIMPPQTPSFDVVLQVDVDPEHMLELGTLVRNTDDSLTLIDSKRPWFWEMFALAVGDTEIDGPANPGSKQLPYLIQVKENETLDIGWALDFHQIAGNQIDYNIRLSSSQTDSTDVNLYINNYSIFTTKDSPELIYFLGKYLIEPISRPDGTILSDGDQYYNTTLDNYFYYTGDCWLPLGSGTCSSSEKQYIFHVTNPAIKDFICETNPNYTVVTVNGVERTPGVDYTALDTKVIFYSPLSLDDIVVIHTILDSEEAKQYVFKSTSNTTSGVSFHCDINPDYTYVTVNGVERLPGTDYTTIDPTKITFNTPINIDDVIVVHTILSTEVTQTSVRATVDTPNFILSFPHNPLYTIVTVNGLERTPGEDYTADGLEIVFRTPVIASDVIIARTIHGSSGITGNIYYQSDWIETRSNTELQVQHSTSFLMLSINGILLSNDKYITTGSTIILDNATTIGDLIQVSSIARPEDRLIMVQPDPSAPLYSVDGENTFIVKHNPDFLYVFVDGILLLENNYFATGEVVIIDNMTQDQNVQIYSIIDNENLGKFVFQQLEYKILTASQSQFNTEYNPEFVTVMIDGVIQQARKDYNLNNTGIILTTPAITDQVVKIYSMLDTVFVAPSTTSRQIPIRNIQYRSAEFTGNGLKKEFTVPVFFDEAPVHIDGMRVRPNQYSLSNTSNTTTILFEVAPVEAAWIIVDYVI